MRLNIACVAMLVIPWGIYSCSVAALADEPVAAEAVGRPVRIVSMAFQNGNLEEILSRIDREAARGTDLIVLPETWRGQNAGSMEPIDGPTTTAVAELARRHRTYILSPIDLIDSAGDRRNTAVLVDREGKVAGTYDKNFPFLPELDYQPPVRPGEQMPVFETDFGKLGVAICFDVNFPEVWQQLSDQGAELVVWPSAYSAGTHLQAYALLHHYYIVTATSGSGDIQAYDITGRRLLDQPRQGDAKEINVASLTLDLDRGIYHHNYNMGGRDKLLRERGADVQVDVEMPREEWFVLQARRPGVSARQLAAEYGLEELRAYNARSRKVVRSSRQEPVAGDPNTGP